MIAKQAFFERVLFENGREWVCRNAIGDVLEVAIGTGRNLPFYPPHVRLTGIEFSPAMLEIARHRAASLGRPVDLRLGDAQALDLPDAAFDTVICTLSLCAIPNEGRAIAEMKRVLRPGGRLVLLDHVIASPAWARAMQWLLERVTVPLGGEHLRRRRWSLLKSKGLSSRRASARSLASNESSPTGR